MTKRTKRPQDATSRRVFRGGGWSHGGPSWVRAAFRSPDVPASRFNNLGFRCALRGREPRV